MWLDCPVAVAVSEPTDDRSEPYPNIECAPKRVDRLRETLNLFMLFIVEDDGTVIWSGPELLHECDARKQRMRDRLAMAGLGQPPK